MAKPSNASSVERRIKRSASKSCAVFWKGLGFSERQRGGSHRIFSRDGVAEILNLQPRSDGTAKPYQVRQVCETILRYRLVGTLPFDTSEMADYRYEIIIYWSEPDQAFVAEVPELAGCAADGPTYRAALEQAEIVIREWIETAQELGRELPKPRGRLLYA